MNNFNWNNYIGPHMSEPLMVEVRYNIFELEGHRIYKDDGEIFHELLYDYEDYEYTEDCKPLIKSISDLTDEEWLFVAGEGSSVFLDKELTCIFKNGKAIIYVYGDGFFELKGGTDFIYAQQLLNRLYSLHVALNAEELIKNGKAVRKYVQY